ncbi:LmeA family phospholipid-binding protein [Microbacterium allomyrinae]|uniref:DUF2993 domain-containing protein n=1 Tax=Microbacterium allomyrinae TaxID=2830666 RepID=A0A9X1LXL3_9MICO|nr:DUF2993 domain-containing protein [Microbacterium allomyrinae]MCC2033518.1 DUF2993 domain-containing protein [Microbacterium allomyrinae]
MTTRDTQPTEPLPDWEHAEAPKRRIWPWFVAFGIVLVLAVVAWFAAEAIARQIVTNVITDEVKTELSLPDDQQIEVEIDGAVIPQLIGGSFGQLTISSDDVAVGDLEGDVTVVAHDVPIRGDAEMSGATGVVALDQEQLRTLMSRVEGFPVDTLALDAPNVTMTPELQLFGVSVPIGVALTPSADEGDLVLTPASLQLGGAEVSAATVRDQFGVIAEAVLQDWRVCIAQYIPAGLTLAGVEVDGDELVATFDVAGGIVSDPALQANGTCE